MNNLTRTDLLILLIEECGEVIQAATKCLRFEYKGNHIKEYGQNDQILAAEVGDLLGVIDELPLDDLIINVKRASKIAKATIAKAKYKNTDNGTS